MDANTSSPNVTASKAPLALIVLLWAIIACALATTGYFFADYLAAQSELSVVNRQIRSLEMSR